MILQNNIIYFHYNNLQKSHKVSSISPPVHENNLNEVEMVDKINTSLQTMII